MKIESDRAVVLRRVNFRDRDFLVDFFSEKIGRFSGIARGARGGKKSWGANFQQFARADFFFTGGKNLVKIVRAENLVAADFDSPEKFFAANFAAELILKFCAEKQILPRVFALFGNSLNFLNKSFSDNFAPIFAVQFFSILGFLGDFQFCGKCGLKPEKSWGNRGGKILCENCGGGNRDFAVLKTLNFWQKNPLEIAAKIKLQNSHRSAVQNFLTEFLRESFSFPTKKLKSWFLVF